MRRHGVGSACILAIGLAGGVLATACSGSSSPTTPTSQTSAPQAATASNGLDITAVAGSGSGTFNLTHTGSERVATGDAQISINVHGVTPNTVLYVLRAGDVGLGTQQNDGICQRADSGVFFTIPGPNGQPLTLETSAGGSGQLHAHFTGPTPNGTQVDAVYRLADSTSAPTVDLRTPCFTFEVK
jgi:hypothetical protein